MADIQMFFKTWVMTFQYVEKFKKIRVYILFNDVDDSLWPRNGNS
jgi:hypothetical protein